MNLSNDELIIELENRKDIEGISPDTLCYFMDGVHIHLDCKYYGMELQQTMDVYRLLLCELEGVHECSSV